jgi:tight adherence protein C
LSGADSAERIRRKLDIAGNPPGWTVDRVMSGKVVGAMAGFVAGMLFQFMLGSMTTKVIVVLGATLAGFFAPSMYLYQRTYDRSGRLLRELPDAIDLLTISVESGLGFDAAVQQVAHNTEGPLAEEFSRVLREMQIGSSRSESLRALAERTNVPELRSFVSSMVQADAFGIPIANVLRVQSSEMRVKRRQRAEEKAQQVPVKMTIPLIFCILPSLFIVIMGPAVMQVMDSFSGL